MREGATGANRDAWDRYAADYQAAWHASLDHDVFWGPAIPGETQLHVLGDVRGRDVVEIGCGAGQASLFLATRGARVAAVDLAPAQVAHGRRLARERGLDVRFHEGSADDLHFLPDASFDVAFSSFAMGFVEHYESACREAYRVLRPGGLFAFSWSSPVWMSTELAADGRVVFDRAYDDRAPHTEKDEYGLVVSFHRTYGDWLGGLVEAGFHVTGILEPRAVGKAGAWDDRFHEAKLRMVPGTTIWRARKPVLQS